jgi:hypothetical protein
MPQNKDLKRLVRARMAASGENYTQALVHVRAGEWLDPLPAAWHLTGSRADDYELGLLPGVSSRTVTGWSGSGSIRTPAVRLASGR